LASDQEPVTPVGPNEAMTAVTGANVGTVNHRAPLQLLTPDRQVTGIYRVARCLQRVSRNDSSYLLAELHDGVSSLRCYCWTPELLLALTLAEGTMVSTTFATYEYQGTIRGRISDMSLSESTSPDDVISTLPSALCPLPQVVNCLRTVISLIREPLLREFVARVFRDYALAKRYFRVPASVDDHHSMPGGHAEHALEMALDSSRVSTLSPMNRDLAIVHSIFHDVGKIDTHDQTPRSRELFRMVNHEALTMYLLAEPLRWLEAMWPDGARSLIVGWAPAWARYGRKEQPVIYPPGELVRGLDRTSRASSMLRDHARIEGGVTELTRQRAIWTPSPPPTESGGDEAGHGMPSDAKLASR